MTKNDLPESPATKQGDNENDFDPVANMIAMENSGMFVAKAVIKSEMAKRHMTYKNLEELLFDFGIEDNERNLRNKVSRGSFTASWFFALMMMMEVKNIDISHQYKNVSDWFDEPPKKHD